MNERKSPSDHDSRISIEKVSPSNKSQIVHEMKSVGNAIDHHISSLPSKCNV
jgi:hypothetical protein